MCLVEAALLGPNDQADVEPAGFQSREKHFEVNMNSNEKQWTNLSNY